MNKPSTKKLNYRVFGNGHPVVFLHGFLESMTMWKELELIGEWQYVFIDLPGHGDSALIGEVVSMKSMAFQVNEILDVLSIESCHLVAHSMGGYVALELLKITPRIEKLVMLNSNFWSDDKEKRLERERVASIVMKNKSLFIYEVIPNLFIDPVKKNEHVVQLINEANKMAADDIAKISIAMSQRIDNISLVKDRRESILIVQGEKDTVVPFSRMKKLADLYNLECVVIPETGHMIHIENAESLTKEIDHFFSSTSTVQ